MNRVRTTLMMALALLLAGTAGLLLPRAYEAAQLMAAADEPGKLADVMLTGRLDAARVGREMEAALAANDPELAHSFLLLADEQNVAIDPMLRARVSRAHDELDSALHIAGSFLQGFAIGEPDDLASLAGTLTGDLFVYGDLRDIVRETTTLARGGEADELVLGLACVGLAVTAGTYATFGAATPARIGVSLIKAAGKSGRLTARLLQAIARPLTRMVDTAALKSSLGPLSLMQPATAVRGVRAAVKLDRADGILKLIGDAGRLQARAGTRAALEGLHIAESPKDVKRLARLAEAKGGKTRAILRLLGRGAIALSVGAFHLASWLFWGLVNILWMVVSLKRLAERMAAAAIRRGKRRRARQALRAGVPAWRPRPSRLPVAPGWGDFVPARA